MTLADAMDGLQLATRQAFSGVNAAIEQLIQAAETSDLTGLSNAMALEREFANVQKGTVPHHVLFGDLNGFKDTNDTYSHSAGDAVLRFAGERLGRLANNWGATAYHKSGDEFVVLVPSVRKDDLVADIKQSFARISLPYEHEGDEVRLELSGSFGCTEIGNLDLAEALGAAETACQIAKNKGDGYVVHESASGEQLITKNRRFRCGHCGTSVRCVLTGEYPSHSSLTCPVCQKPHRSEGEGTD